MQVDNFVTRLDVGDVKNINVYLARFGCPVANESITLEYAPNQTDPPTKDNPKVFASPKSGLLIRKGAKNVQFPQTIKTNVDGVAILPLVGGDNQNCRTKSMSYKGTDEKMHQFPRGMAVSQIYTLSMSTKEIKVPPKSSPNSDYVQALVFNKTVVPKTPNWVEHVGPILRQYGFTFPFMRGILDLTSFAVVTKPGNIARLKRVYAKNVTINSPSYMPVTRDLSPFVIKNILIPWLNNPIYGPKNDD